MNILVSICCLTYNHESHIEKCLKGFIMQKTNFAFEVLIHDDASKDKTAEIIRKYEAKYPDIIKPIYQVENQFSKGVPVTRQFQFPRAKGKYIAMCEGDDYWTNPNKLQKQVDFLESNEDFSICFHKVKIHENHRLVYDYMTNVPNEVTTIVDIAKVNYIHTPSVLFRNNLIKEFPNWFSLCTHGDHPLYILLAQYGKIMCLNDCMAVYRIHKGGNWSQRDAKNIDLYKRNIAALEKMVEYFNGDVKQVLANKLSLTYLDLSEIYLKNGDKELSKEVFIKSTEFTFEALYERYYKYKLFVEKFKNLIGNKYVFQKRLKNKFKQIANMFFNKK